MTSASAAGSAPRPSVSTGDAAHQEKLDKIKRKVSALPASERKWDAGRGRWRQLRPYFAGVAIVSFVALSILASLVAPPFSVISFTAFLIIGGGFATAGTVGVIGYASTHNIEDLKEGATRINNFFYRLFKGPPANSGLGNQLTDLLRQALTDMTNTTELFYKDKHGELKMVEIPAKLASGINLLNLKIAGKTQLYKSLSNDEDRATAALTDLVEVCDDDIDVAIKLLVLLQKASSFTPEGSYVTSIDKNHDILKSGSAATVPLPRMSSRSH